MLRAIRHFVLPPLVTAPIAVLPAQSTEAADNRYDINVIRSLTASGSFLARLGTLAYGHVTGSTVGRLDYVGGENG